MFLIPKFDIRMQIIFSLLKVTQHKTQIYKLCEQREKNHEEMTCTKPLGSLRTNQGLIKIYALSIVTFFKKIDIHIKAFLFKADEFHSPKNLNSLY